MRGAKVVLAALAVSAALAVPASSVSAATRAPLPPASRKALVALFEEKVERLGLRVTRAALVNSYYERDPAGTHLAVYVEPIGDYRAEDYVAGTVEVARVFLPFVFERWKDLRSFDVCQEPVPGVDDRKTPPPETQVYATRAGSRLVDWSSVDLSTMIERAKAAEEAAGTGPAEFSLYVAHHLQETQAYQDAAGAAASTTTTAPAAREYG
jgi:hypothetical protein